MSIESVFSSIPRCEAPFNEFSDRVFLTTNEETQDKTLIYLSNASVQGNAIVGVSCFFLLNAAAASENWVKNNLRPTLIAVDRSERVELFWKDLKVIVQGSSSSAEASAKVNELCVTRAHFYWSGDPKCEPEGYASHYQREIKKEIASDLSWLSNDEKFARIKKVFDTNRFVFLRIDLSNVQAVRILSSILEENSLSVHMLYVSNIAEVFLNDSEKKREFIQSIEAPTPIDSHLIYTTSFGCRALECARFQRVEQYRGSSMKGLFSWGEKDCEHNMALKELPQLIASLPPTLKRNALERLMRNQTAHFAMELYKSLQKTLSALSQDSAWV